MAKQYEYVGNFPRYLAVQYKTRKYTHTEIVKKKEVKHYDCWRIVPEVSTFSGKRLEQDKTQKVHRMFAEGSAGNANRRAINEAKSKGWLASISEFLFGKEPEY